MDMSQTPAAETAKAAETNDHHHATDPKAERHAEVIGFGIVAALIATLGVAFLGMGLAGVGLVAVALVPVIYILLVVMAGGRG